MQSISTAKRVLQNCCLNSIVVVFVHVFRLSVDINSLFDVELIVAVVVSNVAVPIKRLLVAITPLFDVKFVVAVVVSVTVFVAVAVVIAVTNIQVVINVSIVKNLFKLSINLNLFDDIFSVKFVRQKFSAPSHHFYVFFGRQIQIFDPARLGLGLSLHVNKILRVLVKVELVLSIGRENVLKKCNYVLTYCSRMLYHGQWLWLSW